MPYTVVKEYIVLIGNSASFTQHLVKPLNDVIKTDLVSITVNTSPPLSNPIFFIQSANLGGAILTPDNSKSYWRIAMPSAPSGTASNTVVNSRVDSYLDAQRSIIDIDIALLDSSNTPIVGVTSVIIVVEVERKVREYPAMTIDPVPFPGLVPPPVRLFG